MTTVGPLPLPTMSHPSSHHGHADTHAHAHVSPQPIIAIGSAYTRFREPADVPSPVATPMNWEQGVAGPSRRRVDDRGSPDEDGRVGVEEPCE